MIDAPHYDFVLASGRVRSMNNTNKLLTKPGLHWVNGMKTGYTNAAGHCLISSGSLNGRAVVVVVLGCTARQQIFTESEKYLRWAMGV
jgi:D-alanyl-D-alanine carboxypeptidase (penicillin-binding protein 5/6)